MTLMNKTLAGFGAAALLVVPSLAFAHDGINAKGSLDVRLGKAIERIEKKDTKHDNNKDERRSKYATTTAAAITKQATRIQANVDSMLSFDARLTALIAGADATEKAALEAKYAEFKADASNAKIEAGKAITTSAQVNASNSTTTNATLLASAKTDLRESRGFFVEAKIALFSILRSLWN